MKLERIGQVIVTEEKIVVEGFKVEGDDALDCEIASIEWAVNKLLRILQTLVPEARKRDRGDKQTPVQG